MNRLLGALRALVFTAAASFSLIAAAQAPTPPEIAARSYLLLDVTANQILAQKDIDSPVEPAPTTQTSSVCSPASFPVSGAGWADANQ